MPIINTNIGVLTISYPDNNPIQHLSIPFPFRLLSTQIIFISTAFGLKKIAESLIQLADSTPSVSPPQAQIIRSKI